MFPSTIKVWISCIQQKIKTNENVKTSKTLKLPNIFQNDKTSSVVYSW